VITSFTGEYAFLSNFYDCPFTAPWYWNEMIRIAGVEPGLVVWQTNEHYFQAAKARERSQALTIASRPTPQKAKQRGRQVRLTDYWETHKLNVMLYGLRYKFQNPMLADMLRATWPHRLVEGNKWGDDYWGGVWVYTQESIRRTSEGQIAWSGPIYDKGICVGHNWLGRLLELVREEIR